MAQNLFEPFKINQLELKNRLYMAPMTLPECAENGAYTNDATAFYVTRAKGGVGLIITGENRIRNSDGKNAWRRFPSPLTDPRAYQKAGIELTEQVHAYDCKLFVQLASGLGVMAEGDDPRKVCAELTIPGLENLISGYQRASEIICAAGFDGVEIREDDLLACFSMEQLNYRQDQFGGDREGRLTLAGEIVKAIKSACGEAFPVVYRFSGQSGLKSWGKPVLPEEIGDEWGRNANEAVKMASLLEQAGYDALDVMAGFGGNFWQLPPVYFQKGPYLAVGEAVKKAVAIPVLLAGKLDDGVLLTEALKDEKVDAVGLGRALLADPDYPVKFKNDHPEGIRPCLYCNDGCWARQIAGGIGSCTVNPQCNRELTVKADPGKEPKKVVIIGAGPAGLEAAWVSAQGGNSVTLIEAAEKIGGMLKYSSRRIEKSADHQLIAWYENALRALKVDVQLGIPATRGIIAELSPEIVFMAQGGIARTLDFPGKESEKVTTALDVLTGKTYVGPKCLVIGGGLAGCEVALHLAKHRHKMIIVETAGDILNAGPPLASANEKMLRELLDFYHVDMLTNARLQAVTAEGAIISKNGEEQQIKAHHVILATGYEAESRLYDKLIKDGMTVYKIGDSREVRGLRGAIWDGHEVARTL